MRFLAKSVSDEGLTGIWFPEITGGGYDKTIELSRLKNFTMRIKFYYRERLFEYTSPIEFILHQYLPIPYCWLKLERAKQRLYNVKTLIRQERIDVLRVLLREVLEGEEKFDKFWMINRLYGPRSSAHPGFAQLLKYYDMLLDSLVDTGELLKDGTGYVVAPKAFTTIAEYEEDDRRHKNQINLQRLIVVLTVCLVIVGLLQAIVTWEIGNK